MLIALLICSFVAQTLYLNVAVLVPIYVADTFPDISDVEVGLLMAIFPIAYLVSAPLVGSMLTKHGRKSAVIGGVVLMTVSTVIFALAGKLKDPVRYYWVSFLARMVQGIADAVVGVVI
jgi:MFS family permease